MSELNSSLRFCQWDITDLCNLNCAHCRQKSSSGVRTLDMDKARDIILQFEEIGLEACAIAGGEPLADPKFFDLIEELSKKVKRIIVLTNGTLMTHEKAQFLSKMNCSLQVSLDGGDRESYEKMRGINTFSKLKNGIEILHMYNIPFTTRFTITHLNWMETWKFVWVSHEMGAKSCSLRRCIPAGNALNLRQLEPEIVKQAFEKAYLAGKEFGIPVKTSDYFARIYFDAAEKEKIEHQLAVNPNSHCGGCIIGLSALYIAPDGVVPFCPYLPVFCGDLRKEKLADIWKSAKMFRIARSLRANLNGKCSGCRYLMACGGCPASSYAHTGDITESDPACWINQ